MPSQHRLALRSFSHPSRSATNNIDLVLSGISSELRYSVVSVESIVAVLDLHYSVASDVSTGSRLVASKVDNSLLPIPIASPAAKASSNLGPSRAEYI
jgi:hypothetical protein